MVIDYGRRQFVTGLAAGSLLYGVGARGALAQPVGAIPVLAGREFDLGIGYRQVNITGVERTATVVNGSLPAPVLRWREGERVTLRVTNNLAQMSSIHWHGIILPSGMDGVPGLSFDGIAPGETFVYQFDLNQHGTYWYHSHSGFQEQTGVYGAIIVDPAGPELHHSDRDHVILLSDWSDESPQRIYAKLKKQSHYYNFRERTVGDLWRDIRDKGVQRTWNDRQMWNAMRMSDRDIADVTGYTYTYLMNGVSPATGWEGLFSPGEKVRLRFINGSAMSIFDVRIPGLKMTVVAADGQWVEPVTVDEFRIGTAETCDVLVEPAGDTAYTVFAQSLDRSGYARGTLTPVPGLRAAVPAMDHAPVLGHADMGMAHGDHGGGNAQHGDHQGSGHGEHGSGGRHLGDDHGMHHGGHQGMHHGGHQGMHHGGHQGMGHATPAAEKPAPAGHGSRAPIRHAASEFGPQVDMRAEAPVSGLHDPGVGLREHRQRYGRRVLTYADLRNAFPTLDPRDPERELQLHLTGNMSRYMWSFDGIPFADAAPIQLRYGERLRIHLVNDTMMTHPIHLHGLWSELETGDAGHLPRKHTVMVQPGSTISYLVTADTPGRWAFHCHLLYHMLGMMREVRVA